ncbi:MAG: Hsp20/alpha crystallin family protein [Syntrophorhabdales bacterium]|jgi:HSP20 family protein
MAEVKKKEERMPPRPWEAINPFDTVREVMNRMVDSLFEPLGRLAPPQLRAPLSSFTPSVDVIEEDADVRIEVEAPGMGPEDLSVTVGQDSVIIRGEKKQEEVEGKGVHRRERSYGAFHRVIPLPVDVDREKVGATFKNGVLTILLPKSQEAARKVEIKAG